METPHVPVGNLIDLDPDPVIVVPECPVQLVTDGLLELDGNAPEREEEESDATESADSENDMAGSPNRHCWNHSQRSSSESFSSNQSTESARDELMSEQREFVRKYVEKIFVGGEDLDQEEKGRFAELCSTENGKGREWFARFVSAQRCNSKCVTEQTFYRLVQSFAVVLFECHQMDDFGPAKNLMTMCFTYYYIGKPLVSPTDAKEKPVSTGSIDGYLKSANSWLAEKKDNVERLLRTTSTTTENVKGFFGGLESKFKGPLTKKNEQSEDQTKEKPSDNGGSCLVPSFLIPHLSNGGLLIVS
ncbi:hypothetical protein FKM82_003774 [Ascaphus truei]